jgi:hypothetical protein
MKPSLRAFFLCASLACAGQVRATALPDSCGDDKVKFDVKTEEGQPPPAGPTEGKAQIVFIENENQMIGPFMHATVRLGMDGAWVGANYGNSYFALTVAPGVHHLCASRGDILYRRARPRLLLRGPGHGELPCEHNLRSFAIERG